MAGLENNTAAECIRIDTLMLEQSQAALYNYIFEDGSRGNVDSAVLCGDDDNSA